MSSAWSMERGKGGSHARDMTAHRVLGLLCCLLCWSSVVVPMAVVFFVDILRVTHELAILIEPCVPCLPGFIERTWEIVHFPDALVLLRQSVPGEKIPVRQLTSKCGGIPE